MRAHGISNHLGGVANALNLNGLFSGKDPSAIAASILQAARTGPNTAANAGKRFVPAHQLDQVSAALDSLAQDDPKGAETVRGIVMNTLSPIEQGELMRISCGNAKKHASVELGPIEDAPAPATSHAAEKQAPPQIAVGTVLLSDAKGSADGRRALPFFTEAQRLGTPEALRTAALSSIAVYNYEGATAGGVRRNDTDGAGQMKRIAGAQEELLSHVAADMGFPRSDTAVAMRSGYAALAGDATTPAQIREDAAQAVALIDASTTRWDGVLAAVKTNVTMPAQALQNSSSLSKSQVGQITTTVVGKQIETFAKAAIETGASAKDVKYITSMGKGVAGLGSVIVFTDLREQGFTVPASMAGAAASEASGKAIIATGAAIGTAFEPGGGTIVGGVIGWAADVGFGLSDKAAFEAAKSVDVIIAKP
jgi:hypothetical protein